MITAISAMINVAMARLADTCIINVTSAGVITASPDNTSLSGENTGGIPVTDMVTTAPGNSQIQVILPANFDTAPAGSDTDMIFSTKYSLFGATTATNVTGTTNMNTDVTATKAANSYQAGNYQMVATIRCSTP